MSMTDEDRREFVRTHLRLVTAAARTQLLSVDPSADTVTIDDGHLGGQVGGRTSERRQNGDRRKGDRRKVNRPVAIDRRSLGPRGEVADLDEEVEVFDGE